MARNTKTPVMVLQELTVKKGMSPPEYTLLTELTKQGTHENEFHYRLSSQKSWKCVTFFCWANILLISLTDAITTDL